MPSWRATGPLSLQGVGKKPITEDLLSKPVSLRIESISDTLSGPALLHPHSIPGLDLVSGNVVFLQLSKGSDCILQTRCDSSVALGSLRLTGVQQYNLHAASGHCYQFSLFLVPPDEVVELVEVEAEVRLLCRGAQAHVTWEVDAGQLAQQLLATCCAAFVAVNEVVVLHYKDLPLLLRFSACHTLDARQRGDTLGYHCFRGLLMPDTHIFLEEQQQAAGGGDGAGWSRDAGAAAGPAPVDAMLLEGLAGLGLSASAGRTGGGLRLVNKRQRSPAGANPHEVFVHTCDGEVFPVHKRLLRPCIALTQVVRGEEAGAQVQVDVDTLTFDRVLIYLEAEAVGKPAPDFAVHLLGPLQEAAGKLGLRSLERYCAGRLGSLSAQVRVMRFQEVVERNAAGQCWIILDGMVLDVTSWLGEHPGGSTIIPAQALNMDCATFFEVYHASRESFLYLKEFYRGEVAAEDRGAVPCPQQPSPHFLEQLRQFTDFRIPLADMHTKVWKSF